MHFAARGRQRLDLHRQGQAAPLCAMQGRPTTHIAGRADTHPDALPPGPEGASPSRPCEPMGATTIARCFLALSTLSPSSPAEAEHVGMAQDSSQVSPESERD